MSARTRPRMTLFGSMIAVAVIALILGGVVAVRNRRIEALNAQLRRAEGRAKWAEAMRRSLYVDNTTAANEQAKVREVRSQIERLGVTPKTP